MKILLLTSEFPPVNGGIATYVREIAGSAVRLGATVMVYAPDYGAETHAEDRRLPFEVRRFPGGLHSRRDLPAKVALARRVINESDYDVVHAADWPFFIPLALARGRTEARIVMTVHGTEINETQAREKRLAIWLAGVFGPRTEIAANSAYTHHLFRDRFNVPAEQVRTVHLGVSEFWFGPRAPRAITRADLGLRDGGVTMVTVARLTRRKGHLATVAALNALPQAVRDKITWLVIGPDGEADYVQELKATVAASDCDIRLLGALPSQQMRDIYGACDFFALTGNWDPTGRVEGFGLVFLEAAAAGLPSVATDVGGVADAVLHNQTGLLVKPTPEAIAAGIAEMVNDGVKRVSLGKRAATRARHMSWERCAAGTYYLTLPREHYAPVDIEPVRDNLAAAETKNAAGRGLV
ncbi:glycosyltransferase family 4 protein [Microbacteriaceae bacterium K1510]|nr:glycosyltransferase family 4 protein [Microbacteriaceae bacterium K1510]